MASIPPPSSSAASLAAASSVAPPVKEEPGIVQTSLGKLVNLHSSIATFSSDTAKGAETRIADLARSALAFIPSMIFSDETKENIASALSSAANAVTWLALQILHVMPYATAAAFVFAAVVLTEANPLLAVSLLASISMIAMLVFTIKILHTVEQLQSQLKDSGEELNKTIETSIDDGLTKLTKECSPILESGKTVNNWLKLPSQTKDWVVSTQAAQGVYWAYQRVASCFTKPSKND